MNARNKLKTCDLMGIDTHIVYHAHRIHKEWGWGLSKKTGSSLGSKGSCHQIQLQGWGWGLFSSWGSEDSCHFDSASRVGMGSL